MFMLTLLVLQSITFLQAQDIAAVNSRIEFNTVGKTEKATTTKVTNLSTASERHYHSFNINEPNELLTFNLDVKNDYNVNVLVRDNGDRIVYEGSLHNSGIFNYNANLLTPGVYTITLSNSEFFLSKRFVKHPVGVRVLD